MTAPAERTPPPRAAARPPRRRHRGRAVALVALAVLVLAGVGYALLRQDALHPVSAGGSSSGPTAGPLPTRPAAVVRAYYAAITAHEYRRAWRLGGDHTKTTWRQFVAGFRGTERDTVTVLKVSGHVVAARLTALQTDGTTKRFVGSYLVQDGAITGFNVRPAG